MNSEIITVNQKKEHHNCEMLFSFYYDNKEDSTKVDAKQNYKIHTTLEEVELLNEALNLYQSEGFKKSYLLYAQEKQPQVVYAEFTEKFEKSVALAAALNKLCKDEHSLVGLNDYCLDVPSSYKDDFMLNKSINSIFCNAKMYELRNYEDVKNCIASLKNNEH